MGLGSVKKSLKMVNNEIEDSSKPLVCHPISLSNETSIRKMGSKYLMINILAAFHAGRYTSLAIIVSEINPTN